MNKITLIAALALTTFAASALPAASAPLPQSKSSDEMASMGKRTSMFGGAEVHVGFATLTKENGKNVLRLSDDFKIPASPAPHFQVVDADGNTYLLQRLTIVGDKTHREVMLPKYIKSVAKVQIWCAFAEVVLGEATFPKAVRL